MEVFAYIVGVKAAVALYDAADRILAVVNRDGERLFGTAAGRSDSADYSFGLKAVKKHPFVRTGIAITQYTNAFQAYDEGSIPFTRSNPFNYLALVGLKVDTSPGF